MHDDVTDPIARQVASQLSSAVDAIAPPGTARRGALVLAGRGLKALPRLSGRRYVAHKIKMTLIRARGTLYLILRPYQITSGRLVRALRPRQGSLTGPPVFPVHDRVDVSIIIPVFNHCGDTRDCLLSIAQSTAGSSYEVVVVDDGSTDETPEMLGRIEGLIQLRNDVNLGFIASCNRGAAAARGEFLVFLNNDTLVTYGWLEALRRTFDDIPGTGLAGAKLLYPDGRLQEAGGVIWHDASGWNYGKFDDPDHPKYNFAREVDYCSGACLMVRRALFQHLGGFDTEFKPAYYEDTDLAFKIRHAGQKVIYQPLARIVHHEGLTSGRSVRSGVKSHQLVNQAKFRRRWGERLAAHPRPSDAPMRIVHPHGEEAKSRGQVLVIDHPYYRSVRSFLKQHGGDFDVVIISRAEIAARHMATVQRFAPRAKVVFDTVDLHFLREEREAQLKQDPLLHVSAAKRKQQELNLARIADLTLVVSSLEKDILDRERLGLDVRIISTIYPLDGADIPGFECRRNILFIGGFEHPPNADAVLYFAREIFPLVKARIPEAIFQVIGPDPTPEVLRLAGPDIQVLGYVPEVKHFFDQARLSVAPIRYGAGIKGKVNQSMSFGVPAVVTRVAAEGMYLVHEQNAMIADDPEGFADAVVRLWTEPEIWHRLSVNGRENLREHFSVEAAGRRIDELLEWAGLRRTVHGRPGDSQISA